jgi:hypothetical protein
MNMIDLQNMPRLQENEKATVGIAAVYVSEDGRFVSVWNGDTWAHNFTGSERTIWGISDSGELVDAEPYADLDLDDLSVISE